MQKHNERSSRENRCFLYELGKIEGTVSLRVDSTLKPINQRNFPLKSYTVPKKPFEIVSRYVFEV